MRVIVRKERPHPGAQLRFTDIGGHRVTCFATDARAGQLADLELRHRRRARCEDRIRCAKDTGLRNLPLHGFAQNQIWCELVAMACELLAWMAMLALDGPARAWEPKRLRLRLFTAAGRIVRGGRPLRRASPRPGPGPPRSPPRSPACKPSPPADQAEPSQPPGKETRGPVDPRTPGATAGPLPTARARQLAPSHRLRRRHQDHETSRLTNLRSGSCGVDDSQVPVADRELQRRQHQEERRPDDRLRREGTSHDRNDAKADQDDTKDNLRAPRHGGDGTQNADYASHAGARRSGVVILCIHRNSS